MRAEKALARVGAKTVGGAAPGFLLGQMWLAWLGGMVGLGLGIYHEMWRAKRGM